MSKPVHHAKTNGKASPARARGLHVLVVENHSDTRQGVKAFLKAIGYRASFAEDKASALVLAGRETFDLLLSDISLPDGNGWELLQALEAQGRRPAHAVAMSGLGDPADQTRSREAGFERHLVKPFRPEELELALQQATGSQPWAKSVPANPPASAPPVSALRKRLHDGLCQHLAAAALLQGALTNKLELLSKTDAESTSRLHDVMVESRQINRLIDEALEETLSLLRDSV